ncbi:MAG: TMEM165/GDT1 family protein [Anaerolineae bacterium]|nr:TMEM165/GDT1 family protein [Anaerolineae bacterium]MDW8102602.1 TMEM165/GDT1 family protein [Anaerolineae bacterium]
MQSFLIPFVTISLAEIGDKTQLALFCLASRTHKRASLLLGALLAFAITDGLAILFGEFIARVIPLVWVKIIAGVIFIGFGLLTPLKSSDESMKCELKDPFSTAFTMIVVSEMGDKTQIATALFAVSYEPFTVFLGVLCALGLLSVVAIYLGQSLFAKVEPRLRSYLAGSLFILIGFWQLLEIWR